jgi:hypothetical protein
VAPNPDIEKLLDSTPQRSAVQAVRARLARKAADPSTPALFVFAGDNGVGKTRMAHLLSLQASACSGDRSGQPRGESLLEIDATTLKGVDPASARTLLVPQLIAHMRRYPHGMIAVDNFQLLGDVLDHLTPVLTGGYYPEDTSVSFHAATVILMTDFSIAGATQHMSAEDVNSATRELLTRLPQAAAKTILGRAEIVAFVAFGLPELHQAVTDHLMQIPCHHRLVEALHFTSDDVAALTRQKKLQKPGAPQHSNGRMAAWIAEAVLNRCTRAAAAAAYRRTGAPESLDQLPPFTCRLHPNGDGEIEAQVA